MNKKDPLAGVWKQMKQRCRNPKRVDYRYYGAKGVDVCREWETLHGFKKWAYLAGYLPGLTIDRLDPDGDYEPGNCEWVTRAENLRRMNRAKADRLAVTA